jgi:hypothetical protein
MPQEYHYEANCCDETRVEDGPSYPKKKVRDPCPNCGWITTWELVETVFLEKDGSVL